MLPRLALLAVLLGALAAPASAARGLPVKGGKLVPGEHRASFGEVAKALGQGPGRAPYLPPLRTMLVGMKRAGVKRAWIVGSFARPGKAEPGDVDLMFDDDGLLDAELLVATAQRVFPARVHVYPAGQIVDDVLDRDLTPAQRRAWTAAPPTYRQFFQQNPRGPVGAVEIDLTRPIQRLPRQGATP